MALEVLDSDTGIALEAMFGEKSGTGAVPLGALKRKQSREWQYWIRPDGGVHFGPTSRTDAPEYIRYMEDKGWKPLPLSYGTEVAGVYGGSMEGRTMLRHFIRNGGVTAVATVGDNTGKRPGEYIMPREQLISLGMHREPGMVKLRPDLAGVVDYECEYGCLALDGSGKRRAFPYLESRDQHVVAAHKEAIASEAVGKTISKAMGGFQGSAIDPTMIAAIVTAVMQGLKAAPPVEQAAIAQMAVETPVAAPVGFEEDDWEADDDIPEQPPTDLGLPTKDVDAVTIVPIAESIARPAERTEFVAVNSRGNFPNEDWTRSQMWSWMRNNGLAFPENFQKQTRGDTLAYINISFPHMAT